MRKESFNDSWLVKRAVTDAEDAYTPSDVQEEKKEWMVTLPHDAMIWEKRDPENAAGAACGFYPGGNYEYTKTLYVDETEKDQTFILEFEGIYNRGYIYVNGGLAGSVHYGYTGIYVDITPYLRFGEDNQILVRVVNADVPNSRWYTGSGIYRPVSLFRGGSVRIQPGSIRISTPEISELLAAVKVEALIRYDEKREKIVIVKTEILDGEGKVAAEESSRLTLYPQADTPLTQRIYVKNPLLWSIDEPNLYQCKMTILREQEVIDRDNSSFGIRCLEVNPVEGLKVNGRPVLLRGGCIHHDNGPVGAAAFARAEERRIELLKKAGFNSVRVAHNSASKALLDACDRLGMLVMEESYDTWTQPKTDLDCSLIFSEQWEWGLEDIVRKDFNHPSVFMYSIGNEIADLDTPEGARWNRRLAEKLRTLDPTRYVTNAVNALLSLIGDLTTVLEDMGLKEKNQTDSVNTGGDVNDLMTAMLGQMNYLTSHPLAEENMKEIYDTLDLIGMNYMRDAYEQMKTYPNRVFYGSETLPPDIDLNWKKVKALSACIGDYTWSAWDYIGEAGVGIVTYDGKRDFKKDYPAYLAYCGDIDITGYRRPMSYYREIVFGLRKKPYIAVQLPEHYGVPAMCTPWATPTCVSSWTWNGFEGRPCLVEVYSDALEVELIINNKSIGKLPAGEENRFKAVFDTVYEPGEAKAVARYADGRLEEFVIKTADDTTTLCVTADKAEIAPDELAYITIELRDKEGVLNTSSDCKVQVKVEGEGVLQGFGSADPLSEENFFDTERTTYYGRLIAVVRAGAGKGSINLTAEADGMKAASVEIAVSK